MHGRLSGRGMKPSGTTQHYDLLILGSGSTAFAAATRARDLGKTALMIEVRTLGGTCVNRGCLPSKNLLEAAKLVYDAAHPRYPGLTPTQIGVDFATLMAQKDALIQEYRQQHYTSLLTEASTEDTSRIQVVPGRAVLLDAHTAQVTTPNGSVRWLTGAHILIATGSSPLIPDLPGLSTTPYMTSDLLTSEEALELTEQPSSLLILGGGYIALELGQFFARLGTDVTLLERSERILPAYEPEISLALTSLLHEEGLHILTQAEVRQVTDNAYEVTVTASVGGTLRQFHASRLLVATGRRPNTEGLGLEQSGVRLDGHGAVQVDAFLRTSVPHIWAAGDVIGRATESQMATPVGAQDGGIAASNALAGANRQVDHTVIPRAIFTDPPLAVVGLTDAEAVAQGIACQCNTIPMSVVPRAGAIRDTRGVIKMVLERETRRVLGVSMLGTSASEVIHEAAMALRFGATADDFITLIHIYPTMAEGLKLVALSFTRDINTLSCCAS